VCWNNHSITTIDNSNSKRIIKIKGEIAFHNAQKQHQLARANDQCDQALFLFLSSIQQQLNLSVCPWPFDVFTYDFSIHESHF
jgi:hypothetical protein